MKKMILAALAGCALAPTSASATVIYSFVTTEPLSGGELKFTYEAEDYLTDTGFIDRSKLTDATASIQRVRFLASCPMGGGPAACDQVFVVAGSGFGSTIALRYFTDGAFTKPGSYTGSSSTPSSLTVAVSGAVPEPATWAMMILGFGVVGAALRRRVAYGGNTQAA